MAFWNKPKPTAPGSASSGYEVAKEATRRAAFLNFAGRMSNDEGYREQLRALLGVCRNEALAAGKLVGKSATEIDAEIGALCDSDVNRLQQASDQEFQNFAVESGAIVKRFLADRGIA